ncbi:histidinol-phosphate transaminase [Haematomicrobium sanguinis]|uniref:histidinol-phosphate transaminase n=1 Tax=Haematomicrobium sanguinis TaxID=479106 RepID=UPI00047B71BC|nr:histidinol-phosphate transaminase [Haematomicrobium sanguinis]
MSSTTTPQPRNAVSALPKYAAGKPPVTPPGVKSFKLSSNENPYPMEPEVAAAIAEASAINRYPDPQVLTLRTALAEDLGVPVEDIVTGGGSLGALQQILAAFAGDGEGESQDEVLYAWRSFEAYPILVGLAGAKSVQIPNRTDGAHDLDAMAAAITENTKVILLCTPNNPTGPTLHTGAVQDFLAKVPAKVVVVIDEAYVEFVRDPEAVKGLDFYREYPNVIVLRTFSKAYGLAGLRVGYSVSQAPVTQHLRAAATPFGVNMVAESAAVASLKVKDKILANVEQIVQERDRVKAALAEAGWAIPDPQGNFVWLETGTRTAEFRDQAEVRGISVRAFGDEGVRVSIGEPEANDVFLSVAREFKDSEK